MNFGTVNVKMTLTSINIGRLLVDVGLLVAAQCDRFVESCQPGFQSGKIEVAKRIMRFYIEFTFLSGQRILRESRVCKARMLNYFPIDASSDSSWCGWYDTKIFEFGELDTNFYRAGTMIMEGDINHNLTG